MPRLQSPLVLVDLRIDFLFRYLDTVVGESCALVKGMPRCQGCPVGKGPAPRRRCNGSRSLGLGAYDALRGTGTCIRYEPLLSPFLHRLPSASATEVPLDVNAALRNLLLGISEDNLDGRSCEWREVSGVVDSSGAARISFLGCWGMHYPR